MPRAHGYAEAVEQGAYIEVVDAADVERHHRAAVGSRAVDAHPADGRQAVDGTLRQGMLMGGYGVEADRRHIAEGHRQGVAAHIVGRAGLELVGQCVVFRVVECHVAYHFTPSLIGRHAIEPAPFAIEHPDARGGEDLVSREDIEVGIQRADVHLEMRHGLRPVDEHGYAAAVGRGDDVGHGIDGAQHVGHVGDGHEACAAVHQPAECVEVERAVVIDRCHAHLDAAPCGEHLPRHDVAVVLHGGDDDFVALAHECFAKRLGDEVDALGGAAREDYLIGAACPDEGAHGLACGFVHLGGLLREEVHAAVDVGVGRIVFVHHRLDYLPGLLRRGGVVEVDERAAIDGLGEYGEVFPQSVYVEHGLSGLFYLHLRHVRHAPSSPRNRFSTSRCSLSLSASMRRWSMTSFTKALMSSVTASLCDSPRWRM